MPSIYLFEPIQPRLFLLCRQVYLTAIHSLVGIQCEHREIYVKWVHSVCDAVFSNLLLYVERVVLDLEFVKDHLLYLFLTCWLLDTLWWYPSIISSILLSYVVSAASICYHRTLQRYKVWWKVVLLHLWLLVRRLVCIGSHQLIWLPLCTNKILVNFIFIKCSGHCILIINFFINHAALYLDIIIFMVQLLYLFKPIIVVVYNRYLEFLFWRRRRLFLNLPILWSKGLIASYTWLDSIL